MSEAVLLNKYGFYELKQKPSNEELKDYYAKKYYQTNQSIYESSYSDEELLYFKNKIEQRELAVKKLLPKGFSSGTLLDIGCGEGFTLNYFKERNWNVTGMDYSDFGCKKFNPDCLPHLLIGDTYQLMQPLIQANTTYDVIWLDNVLEHVLDPLNLLNECKKLLHKDGVMVVEVPNDFSVLQKHLLDKGYIGSEFWVVIPDHISYFNNKGLTAIAAEAGFKNEFTMGDFPIDFGLINPDTNYNKDKTKGKNMHHSRIEIDNLMHSISAEKTVAYYKAIADLGLGRQLIAFLKHSDGI